LLIYVSYIYIYIYSYLFTSKHNRNTLSEVYQKKLRYFAFIHFVLVTTSFALGGLIQYPLQNLRIK